MGDGGVLCFDSGEICTTVYNCPNSSHSIVQISEFYCIVNYTSGKLDLKVNTTKITVKGVFLTAAGHCILIRFGSSIYHGSLMCLEVGASGR